MNWPVGLGGKGNEGVSGLVKQTPGSIGYTELSYAIRNGLSVANVQNRSGNFIQPSIESKSKAAEGVDIPSDFRVSIVNSANAEDYPIAGFTWLLVYKSNDDAANTCRPSGSVAVRALATLSESLDRKPSTVP